MAAGPGQQEEREETEPAAALAAHGTLGAEATTVNNYGTQAMRHWQEYLPNL